MRVLVIGSGGREHALCWKLAASPLLTKLWCAPGNPGTAEHAENVPIGVLDIADLVRFAQENAVDLVVPGPEAPLVAGLTDAMGLAGIACCGPSAAAARLEARLAALGGRAPAIAVEPRRSAGTPIAWMPRASSELARWPRPLPAPAANGPYGARRPIASAWSSAPKPRTGRSR